jgi:putative SOS response-associated peptidase YedK
MCGRARASFGEASVDRSARACCSGAGGEGSDGQPAPPLRRVDMHLYKAKHNMSPGDYSPILYVDSCTSQLTARACRWGLHPSFAPSNQRPNFFKAFNARSETVASKSFFSRLMAHQRCIVLLNGFYEYVLKPSLPPPCAR